MKENTDLIYIGDGREYIVLMYGTVDNPTCCLLQEVDDELDFDERTHLICSELYPSKKSMNIVEEFDNYSDAIESYSEKYLLD